MHAGDEIQAAKGVPCRNPSGPIPERGRREKKKWWSRDAARREMLRANGREASGRMRSSHLLPAVRVQLLSKVE